MKTDIQELQAQAAEEFIDKHKYCNVRETLNARRFPLVRGHATKQTRQDVTPKTGERHG